MRSRVEYADFGRIKEIVDQNNQDAKIRAIINKGRSRYRKLRNRDVFADIYMGCMRNSDVHAICSSKMWDSWTVHRMSEWIVNTFHIPKKTTSCRFAVPNPIAITSMIFVENGYVTFSEDSANRYKEHLVQNNKPTWGKWLESGFELIFLVGPKWVQCGPKLGPKCVQGGSKVGPNWVKNVGPNRVQSGSKVVPKWVGSGSKAGSKSNAGLTRTTRCVSNLTGWCFTCG